MEAFVKTFSGILYMVNIETKKWFHQQFSVHCHLGKLVHFSKLYLYEKQ